MGRQTPAPAKRATSTASPPPGNLDPFNVLRARYASADAWGIPLLLREDPEPPEILVPYKTRVRTDRPLPGPAVHFFMDDPNFEPVWNRPTKGLSYVARFGRALSPDFSLFGGFPLAVQLMQVYKNRWCGRFWQDNGVRVVPTISWSDRRSYPFAFAGVPKGSLVAVSTVGLGGATVREASLFRAGYEEMARALDPELVLLYGEVPLERFGMREGDGPPVRTYPSRWQGIRSRRRADPIRPPAENPPCTPS